MKEEVVRNIATYVCDWNDAPGIAVSLLGNWGMHIGVAHLVSE
jgi:hypothetical protein